MVDRLAGTNGVAGGELRGGGGVGRIWGFGLWWFLIVFERLGGSARPWGVERWCWKCGVDSVCDGRDRRGRRPNRPETMKKASRRRWLAMGALEEWPEVA